MSQRLRMLRGHAELLAGTVVALVALGACTNDESPELSESVKASVSSVGASLVDEGEWELAPNPPEVSRLYPTVDPSALSEAELASLREEALADPTWRAADGTRYESMMVTPGGKVYGRKGPSPMAPRPTEDNKFGSEGNASDEALRALKEAAAPNTKTRIWTSDTNDDRGRISTFLNFYP